MSERFVEAVEELQKRVDMLHVLAGIEVSDLARGGAVGAMQAAIAALDDAATSIVQSSGMTDDEWHEFHIAEIDRRSREWKKKQRERRRRA